MYECQQCKDITFSDVIDATGGLCYKCRVNQLESKPADLLDAAEEILRDFNMYGEVLQQGDNGEYGTESAVGQLAEAIAKAEGK